MFVLLYCRLTNQVTLVDIANLAFLSHTLQRMSHPL